MYTYMYMNIYIYISYVYVYIHVYIYISMYTNVHIYMYTCIYIYIYLYTYIYMYVYMLIYIYIYILHAQITTKGLLPLFIIYTYVRDLYIYKRPVHMKRDLQRLAFKTRNVPNLMCVHTHKERTQINVHTYTYICFSQSITAPCQLPSSSYYTLFKDALDVDNIHTFFSI